MFAVVDLRSGHFVGALDGFFIGRAYHFIDGVIGLSSEFLVVGEVDDFCAVGDGFDVFFAQFSEEGVDVVLELVSLDLQHSAADVDVFGSRLLGVVPALRLVRLLLLLRVFLLLFSRAFFFLGLLVLHPEVVLVGGHVGEELHALLAALEVGAVFLLLGVAVVVVLLAHPPNFKLSSPRSMPYIIIRSRPGSDDHRRRDVW